MTRSGRRVSMQEAREIALCIMREADEALKRDRAEEWARLMDDDYEPVPLQPAGTMSVRYVVGGQIEPMPAPE